MKPRLLKLFLTYSTIFTWAFFILEISSHGNMYEPPNRSSLWRFEEFDKFQPEINYNDIELYCGGFNVQFSQNDGKCGICGDNWADPVPRDNEDFGKYGKGIIVRSYKMGETIDIIVNLTTTHRGHMEFRLCPRNSAKIPGTQECLDKHRLYLENGSSNITVLDEHRTNGTGAMYYDRLRLPSGITCSHCILQWHYRTGNTWGICDDGINFDCGPQETFRGCSDIKISPPSISGNPPLRPSTTKPPPSTPSQIPGQYYPSIDRNHLFLFDRFRY